MRQIPFIFLKTSLGYRHIRFTVGNDVNGTLFSYSMGCGWGIQKMKKANEEEIFPRFVYN